MQYPEWIGWVSSLALLVSLGAQVNKQWETRSVKGVSGMLYAGQVLAEIGFVAYSVALRNWVFLFTNAALLLLNVTGLVLYLRRMRRNPKG